MSEIKFIILLIHQMHAIQMAQDESEFVSTFYWLPLNWAGNLLISGVYLEYHKCYEFDIIHR